MKVAVLGTGMMGAALAEVLIAVGHDVIVYNRSVEKTAPLIALGAKGADTPATAIAAADASIIVVQDVQGVTDMLLNEMTRSVIKGKKILNASTTKPDEIRQIALRISELDGDLAEMSIMVGSEQLRNKQGQFILGCSDASNMQWWSELLQGVGERVDYAGKVGAASEAETPILLTSMFGVVTAAYAAAAALKLNVSKEISEHYIPVSAPGSEYFLPNLLARNYDNVMASIDSFASVSSIAIHSAQHLGLSTQILEGINELFSKAVKRGFGSKDGTAIGEILIDPES